jgi:hypothetical protein
MKGTLGQYKRLRGGYACLKHLLHCSRNFAAVDASGRVGFTQKASLAMDSSLIAALSAILGTTVGGLTTFATTFLNQRYAMRRDILARDVANREQLYSDFLREVGNLYFDSVNRTLKDTSQQASLITMYSLLGRIRMISSEVVLTSAEKVADDIVECYKRPPTSFQEFQQTWDASNPWHEFTKACREERESMLGRL